MDIDLLAKMIKKLILDRDKVILPGLGCFVAEMVPSTFSDRGYTINPPYRRLYFRSKPDEGGELAAFYSRTNDVPLAVAENVIHDFLEEMKAVLYIKKAVVFPGLGRLRATKENDIFFVADEDLDIYPAGFGLEPVSLKSHEETAEDVGKAVAGLKSIIDRPVENEPVAPAPVVTPAPVATPAPVVAPAPVVVSEPVVAPAPVVVSEPEPVQEKVSEPVSEVVPSLVAETVSLPVQEKVPEPVQEEVPAPVQEEVPETSPVIREPEPLPRKPEPLPRKPEPTVTESDSDMLSEEYDDFDIPSGPSDRKNTLLDWLTDPRRETAVIVIAVILGVIILFFLIFIVVAHLCPDMMDKLLYTKEELEILNHIYE